MVSGQCAESSRYMCMSYDFVTVLNPPFRDSMDGNNWQCVDISGNLRCNDGKFKR